MMKTKFLSANDRGHAQHGWLDAKHSFSFASYHDPEKVHFGALRVLNDDTIAAGAGFGEHPHDNMEIVTIPLSGQIEHKDSMGNGEVLSAGEVQIMSAGTGIRHSEFNPNDDQETRLFQIWVFPRERGIEPDYGQRAFEVEGRQGKWQTLVSPQGSNQEGQSGPLLIHQDAYFSRVSLQAGQSIEYNLHNPDHGLYLMNIQGEFLIEQNTLGPRDALEVQETSSISIQAKEDGDLLAIEIPMTLKKREQ